MSALKLQDEVNEAELLKQGYRRENLMYRLSPEEITELCLQRDSLMVEIEDIIEEKKEAVKGYNDIIKMKQNLRKPISRATKTGYIEKELLVMASPNYDDGTMEYYNLEGVMVHDRPLKPTERQTNIMSAFKN